jgi:hypothetical protein
VDLPATESRLSLYLWGRLTPPETQQVLKRIGRLYKNSCWWPNREKPCLFDKAAPMRGTDSELAERPKGIVRYPILLRCLRPKGAEGRLNRLLLF